MSTETQQMDAKMAACMAHARPTDQHGLLRQFEGAWKAEVKMWMGPGEPQVSTGTMTNTLILNGLFLEHDYRDDAGMFQGKGTWGYNTLDKRWEGQWLDTMASWMQLEQGHHDPATNSWHMVGQMTDPGTGQILIKRSLIRVVDENTHVMEMYFTTPLGENKGMEITYRRA